MNIDKYLVFASEKEARQFLDRLGAAMHYKEVWVDFNVHPFEERTLVPWSDAYLSQYGHLLKGIEQISLSQAREQGFIFGRHKGPFSQARSKLEEAQLLQEALIEASSLPNFPVYRALFFGLINATYALEEAVRNSCKRLGGKAETWFESQFLRLKDDPVIWTFYQMHNEIKHHPDNLPLHSFLQMRSSQVTGCPQDAKIVMSSEGVIGILDEGTSREKVTSLAGVTDVDWQVIVDMPNHGVSGPATQLAIQVLHFYEQLVYAARKTFGGEPNLKP